MFSGWRLALLAAVAAMAWSPSAAKAGTFDVLSCNSAPGYVNNAWYSSSTGYASTRLQCPAGYGLEASASAGSCYAISPSFSTSRSFAESTTCTMLPGGTAKWVLTAATGTTLQSFQGTWRCSGTSSFGKVGVRSPSGGTGTGACTSSGFTPVSRAFNAGATVVELFATFNSCHISDPGCSGHQVSAALAEARTTVRDDQLPTSAVRGGSLTTGGVKTGIHAVTFDASDSVGVRRAELLVDGDPRAAVDYTCDYSRTAPCSSQTGSSLVVDTARFADGAHEYWVEVEDAAGNLGRSGTGTFSSSNPGSFSATDQGHGTPEVDEELPPESEPDPTGASTCDPDPELGADDYCPQIEEPETTATYEFSANRAASNPALDPGGSGWGMSEQRWEMFPDPRFAQLSTEKVRYIAAWDQVTRGITASASSTDPDIRTDHERLRELDRFVSETKARGQEMLLSFGAGRDRAGTTSVDENEYLPSHGEYKRAVNATLARYKSLRRFTAWNEPNHGGQPTSFKVSGTSGPKNAAQFFKLLKRVCKDRGRTCAVAAGDFLDTLALNNPNAPGAGGSSYYRRYVDALRKARVDYWAIHPYRAGRGRTGDDAPFRRFVGRTGVYNPKSNVWVTEYGQQVSSFGDDVVGSGRNLRTVMALRRISDRVTRFYYYKFFDDPFATGLIDPNGSARCLYFVFRYNSNPSSSTPAAPAPCPNGPEPGDAY